MKNLSILLAVVTLSVCIVKSEEPLNISGVYPSLTMYNKEGECGTGAVVPWQGSLWAITYAPHSPKGSTDKLYEITSDLKQVIFPGSVGGTPANRLIHETSNQLLIGPYLIDGDRNIRVIPPSQMYGRLTGTAPHLTDPNKVYYATMEQGLYEVDVNTLEVTCHIRDRGKGAPKEGVVTKVPGVHGKGLYSGHGRVVYSNNGEKGRKDDPTITAGVLAQWFSEGDWQTVKRSQFTEISGPGGIYGNKNPDTDPIWAMGWDAKSLLLGLLEGGEWFFYRIPKGSHSYDGSHGWNTEWPRIREIGESDFLATMHGTFWRFPANFSRSQSAGIAPRSNYLKVIGDFCRWNDRIILGCDDSAEKEFLNRRSFKAEHGAPKQSNSNLWFVEPGKLDQLGPSIGRGSVWLREDLDADAVSDPYLFSGYDYRQLHLTHQSDHEVIFTIEVDRQGNNQWTTLRQMTVPPKSSISELFSETDEGAWVRLKSHGQATAVTANFQYRSIDARDTNNHSMFNGLANQSNAATSYGLMRSLAFDRLGLVAASDSDGTDAGYYELTPAMELKPMDQPNAAESLVQAVKQPLQAVSVDEASVLVVEDGKRYRLPKSPDFVYQAPQAKSHLDFSELLKQSLTRNAVVKSSSQHEKYSPGFAVDGQLDEASRWIGNNDGETWIEIEMADTVSIHSFCIYTGWKNDADYAAKNFDIQTMIDGKWQTLPEGNIRNNNEVCKVVNLTHPVKVQSLRLISSDQSFFRVYEFAAFDQPVPDNGGLLNGFSIARICREVATERDLLNVHGTFYELPARNAQGMAKIRPVSTHNLYIHDFCSHNGLLLFTGLDSETKSDRIFRSKDSKAAVWAGVVDDLWELGKARGVGGPWKRSEVEAGKPSDPYLMTAYDEKSVKLSATDSAAISLEVDIDGTDLWIPYQTFKVAAGETVEHTFPKGFSAYWVRAISDTSTVASVEFEYR